MALTVVVNKGGGDKIEFSEHINLENGNNKYKSLQESIEKMKKQPQTLHFSSLGNIKTVAPTRGFSR